jgi:hypothetical protein
LSHPAPRSALLKVAKLSAPHHFPQLNVCDGPIHTSVSIVGTKTAAVISDRSGEIIGCGFRGPSNVSHLTVEQFIATIKGAVEAALQQAVP